jgi:lysophospholipase L1-like esterase
MLKALICCLVLLPRQGWTPSDGDRVVVLGGALLEQEIRTAHWETEVTRRLPKRAVVWRNLAWSGDTVRGEARAVFGTPNDGFNALVKETLRLKPTVIYFGYGLNESFAGEKGLPEFRKDYERLIQALAPTKARMGFMTVPLMVRVSSLLPDPAKQNRNIQAYNRVIREIASEKGGRLVELENLLDGLNSQEDSPNGMHLTATGYEKTAGRFAKALGLAEDLPWEVQLEAGKAKVVTGPIRVTREGDKLSVSSDVVPPANQTLRFRWKAAQAGRYEFESGGVKVVATNGPDGLVADLPVGRPYENLRQLVVDKDMLFFHRWRPQNETYLFGFRKHEQGNNAREIPMFDPLVDQAEKKIAEAGRFNTEITWKSLAGAKQ